MMRPVRSRTILAAISTTALPSATEISKARTSRHQHEIGGDLVARPADRAQAAGILEGLQDARLHQLGQPVLPLRAAELRGLVRRRPHHDLLAVIAGERHRLGDHQLAAGGPACGAENRAAASRS